MDPLAIVLVLALLAAIIIPDRPPEPPTVFMIAHEAPPTRGRGCLRVITFSAVLLAGLMLLAR